ncbi:uncharacterized protein LOC128223821 isoform X2 [Mya arenaria]|uniref:uncharacterized protein LOC128223821 isoform X2 n=1 Tax=Mya arenaria TaxID=6604 RepID=UPI0022E2133B|nr:uncharacterized protein LOC128223821 isoform X2 [Mya arenaria]
MNKTEQDCPSTGNGGADVETQSKCLLATSQLSNGDLATISEQHSRENMAEESNGCQEVDHIIEKLNSKENIAGADLVNLVLSKSCKQTNNTEITTESEDNLVADKPDHLGADKPDHLGADKPDHLGAVKPMENNVISQVKTFITESDQPDKVRANSEMHTDSSKLSNGCLKEIDVDETKVPVSEDTVNCDQEQIECNNSSEFNRVEIKEPDKAVVESNIEVNDKETEVNDTKNNADMNNLTNTEDTGTTKETEEVLSEKNIVDNVDALHEEHVSINNEIPLQENSMLKPDEKIKEVEEHVENIIPDKTKEASTIDPPSVIIENITETSPENCEINREEEPMDIEIQKSDNLCEVVQTEDVVKEELNEAKTCDSNGSKEETDCEKSDSVETDSVKTSSQCDNDEKKVEIVPVNDPKPSTNENTLLPRSPSKLYAKGQKLDQLLTKITNKAVETDSTKPKPIAQKHAKARKSCGGSNTQIPLAHVSKPTLTSLTFNVKELEKTGVLDMPKPSKRKAFEPIKIPSPDFKAKNQVSSPVHTPVKSPVNSESQFIKKRLKGVRKKKGRRLGGYKLPGEKKYKKRESEERQTGKSKKEKEEKSDTKNDKICSEAKTNTDICVAYSSNVQADLSKETKSDTIDNHKQLKPDTNSMKNGDTILVPNNLLENPQQMNALEMLTKNAKRSFASASSTKKAKKTVRQGIDPLTHRTLDSFLRAGSHSQLVTSGRKIVDKARPDKSEGVEMGDSHISEHQRKRKASGPMKVVQHVDMDTAIITPEEKKQRLDGNQPRPLASPVQTMARSSPAVTSPRSPQLLTTLKTMPTSVSTTAQRGAPVFTLLTSSPPRSAQTSGGGTQSTLILAAGSKSPSQTILQRGMLNGLPMFQIVSNQTIVSSSAQGQAQYVTLAQSQTKSELTSSSKMSLPSAVPVLFTPVQFSTAVTSVVNTAGAKPITTSLLTSIPSTYMPPNNFMVSSSVSHSNIQKDHSVLKQKLKSKIEYRMPNGQFLDARHPHGADHRGVPNGLYPVTPPRTPPEQKSHSDEQRSETESQGEIESSASGSATSDKDVVPLCTCKISGTSFQKMASNVTFCQALDSVDGKVLGCCNKVTNPQLVRPAVKIPFLAVCEHHRKRLRSHQCCPGCGHFCTQGRFLQCTRENSTFVHHFHEACQVSRGDGKNLCPHCGEASSQYEVSLTLPEGAKSAVPKQSKTSKYKMKARIGLADRRSASVEKEAMEETAVSVILDKTKKTISTNDLPLGPDRYSLERVLSTLGVERPKKYRHLPKCLYTPAYDNDLEKVVYMLEDGHDPRESYDDLEGQSALHAAAAVGSLPIVHVLIQAGASPHVQDIYLKTPLMFAAESNHIDVTYYLIKANATVDAKADDGMTALHLAAKAGHLNVINILLDTDRIPIDTRDDGGWTPLIWAAEHMEMEAVKLLLKRKADPNLRDTEENTTMHWAAFSGSVSIAEQLLSAGCDLDSLNMHGDRPLHIAARQDHYECVVLFLARGADVEAKNNKGESPLECCMDQTSPVYTALKVNKQLKSFGAKHMGRPEKLLHRDLSKGRENIPIPCVNGVDDSGIPTDYLYVTDNIETMCLQVNRVIGSLQTCQCKDDCSSIYCACGKNSLRCWYDKYGRLAADFNMQEPPLLFECNRACECWTTCNNRVVQNGVMSRLQVFKTAGRGWGCKTLVDIPRGTFICEYIGEHISDSEADRREDDSYLFDLDNKDGETYCIDARRYGNVARFINHLCEPNLVPVKVFVDSQDLRFPRICLFASRDIKAQEELGFDYGEKFWIIKWKQFTCTCGSEKCRYSNDTIQKTLTEYRQKHELDDPID